MTEILLLQLAHRIVVAPDEMYFGTGSRISEQLEEAKALARLERLDSNPRARCEACEPALVGVGS